MGFPLTFMKTALAIKYSKLTEGFKAILGEKQKKAKSMTPRLLTILYKNGMTEGVRNWRSLTLLNSSFKTLRGIAWKVPAIFADRMIHGDPNPVIKGRKIIRQGLVTEVNSRTR